MPRAFTAKASVDFAPPEAGFLLDFAERTLREDLGPGDVTTWVSIPPGQAARARIFAKEPCILAGGPIAAAIFSCVDPALRLTPHAADGARLAAGQTVLEIAGAAAAILTAERSALNLIQQLSGVASRTRQFVDAVAGTGTRILDTRKTVPGLRALQKYAVRCGGGTNHRFGLYDRFLFKDNHLALCGTSLARAVARARTEFPHLLIEVEADRIDQVRSILELNVDSILLDNMALAETRACVELIAGRTRTEASGNMTLERVRPVAETGVDFISVGELTHSVRAIDFSLEILPA